MKSRQRLARLHAMLGSCHVREREKASLMILRKLP
jgi:hypothetical protein